MITAIKREVTIHRNVQVLTLMKEHDLPLLYVVIHL